MHEMSIVEHLFGVIKDIAEKEHLTSIQRVEVEIGGMRQIVPDLFQFAFDAAKDRTIAAGAELGMTFVPIQATCNACGAVFEVQLHEYVCSSCGTGDVKVTAGKEILITSIEGDCDDN